MKLQLAIDRTTIARAAQIVYQVEEQVDIIELGTSFFKDYGLVALKELRSVTDKCLLADVKTIDEAEYEFEQIFKHGADIATVMGNAAIDSIKICQKVAQKYNKSYMIDTLEVSEERMKALGQFTDGIICLHLPIDKGGNLQEYLLEYHEKYQYKNQLAIAGGVKLTDITMFKNNGVDIVIVGSGITKSNDLLAEAKLFKELL